jgi:endonuclease YncB( thermonuclease family)
VYKYITILKGSTMKQLLALLLLLPVLSFAATKTPKGVTYDTQILKVTDGDTIVIAAPFLPAPLKPQLSVRIFGVDTPEKGHRAQCPKEAQMGEQASQYTKAMVAQGRQFQVTLYGWDKFGGRVLGDILVNGQSVRQGLLANGFAREYFGEAKQSWCN